MSNEWRAEHKMAVAEFLRGFNVSEHAIGRVLVALQLEHYFPGAVDARTEICSHCGADLSTRPVLSTVATAGFAALEEARRELAFWTSQGVPPTNGDPGLAVYRGNNDQNRKRAAAEVARLEKKTANKDPVANRRVSKKPLQVVYRTSIEGSLGNRAALTNYPAISFRLCAPCAVKAVDTSGRSATKERP
jgi:hypothetical protein